MTASVPARVHSEVGSKPTAHVVLQAGASIELTLELLPILAPALPCNPDFECAFASRAPELEFSTRACVCGLRAHFLLGNAGISHR